MKKTFRANWIALATVAVALAGVMSAGAQGDAEKHWKAQWITAAGVAERDQAVLHFRKALELKEAPAKFVVDVSADNQFILYVNGREAGRGPSRGDLAHWRYETYDIAPLLHAGKNTLAGTVWHFGTHAAIAQMSERTGFLLHGAGEAESVADTNETWLVEEEKGITPLQPRVNWYYAAEPGLRIDGGKFDWDANSSDTEKESFPQRLKPKSEGSDDVGAKAPTPAKWTKAVTLGRGALREERDAPNNWQLVSDPLPAMEMTEVPSGKVVRAEGVAAKIGASLEGFGLGVRTKVSVLIDNGELTTGYPALTVLGGRGAKIRLTYAEALYDAKGNKGNRNEIVKRHIEGVVDEFLPGGGAAKREFVPLSWRTWRYLQIDAETTEAPMTVVGLKTWFSAYPFEEKGYFHSNDSSLEPIWKIGWRTARLDAHDTYMDTPYWERLQYVGDTRIQALISYTVAGDDRLGRQAIEAFNDSRVTDGLTQSRYPSSLRQMIPTFSLMWVGMVHDFWMYRGDAEFVREQIPGTRTALDWFLRRQRADGLLEKIPWWPFVDWGADFVDGVPPQEEDGGSAVMTLQFVEALRYGAELERAFGDANLAKNYERAAVRAGNAVRTLCWNDKYGLLADTPAQKHFSQHANILGLWLDVIPAARQREVLTKILSKSDEGFASEGEVPEMTEATYYFRFYLARAAEHAGMGDEYLKLLGPWRTMVALGLTTWAESPEPTRSDSHAWSAHPNFDLLRIVAGIRPTSAGFETVAIEPHLGKLAEVKAGMPTPRGMMEVEYKLAAKGVETRVKLPAGVKGELVWRDKKFAVHEGEQVVLLP
ncbi:MAG TPA: alpha-L-rhamnosidase C-terminal domain-containing protein [Candidatus Dormibacteraeota bacterium]|jgi:alpha-L-rhamnosidase|nr:alpha-L-rhamnosidase C-terminal domain-containing protein [Candidatus Dormibacteraeota bacterium]